MKTKKVERIYKTEWLELFYQSWIVFYGSTMGVGSSRQVRTEQELAYHIRSQNCKTLRRIYSIIGKAYKAGYLTEFEFQATIAWYHGLKFRSLSQEEEIYVQALDKLNDLICTLIHERQTSLKERAVLGPPLLGIQGPKTEKLTDTFQRIMETGPYSPRPKL